MTRPSLARRYVSVLPRGSALVLTVDAVSAFGFGASFPFLTVYLTATKGFDLVTAGAVAALLVVSALVGAPVGGALADRVGPRMCVALGFACDAAGTAGLLLATDSLLAGAAAVVCGFGASMTGPATDTALATAVAPEQRSTAFSLKHIVHNIGMGAGSVAGALVIDPSDSSSYAIPFTVDIGAAVVAAALGLFLTSSRPEDSGEDEPAERVGYAAVARDPLLRRILGVALGLFVGGFGAFSVALPAHMAVGLGLDPRLLGVWFTVNTVVVIGVQLLALRMMRGRRRTSALAVMAALWAAGWGLVLYAGTVGVVAATVLVLASAAVFGVGETLFAPTLPVLVNAIAPPSAVGRYNGAFAFVMTVGNALSMVLAGLLLHGGLAGVLFTGCLVVCLVSGCAARRLVIPAAVDRST
ncbi:MFS transporter [Actinokineospora sp. 24-640]